MPETSMTDEISRLFRCRRQGIVAGVAAFVRSAQMMFLTSLVPKSLIGQLRSCDQKPNKCAIAR
ncbi:uncharacterized protein PHALS_15103 [Plasmopara halstedii]|uniref:Uncharacterized protein n=1 Tax=Plasmopara halstedii TaxID=4781 RepID=A0A0P1B081_PLAHL|nr:uncharacterized protein PHALS_15103 [Plasmopara halstedii]CEG48138.1 hypothetical protein PHALS_15103 [Plasmopara halstedii]|eukprot:XP_024584507.1 hypothetical protein PHALS_15103 [Plasmopara halstedii]